MIRVTNGSFAVNLGTISIQPVTTATTTVVQSTTAAANIAPITPATQAVLAAVEPASNIAAASSAVQVINKSVAPDLLFDIASSATKDIHIIPKGSFSSVFNIQPNYVPFKIETRYDDSLPKNNVKFTPYEELSGLSSTRPEILLVSEFKSLFNGNNKELTSAGEFLDAQVKIMNLRHETAVSLINDLKKDNKAAALISQAEGDFLLHMRNLKSRVEFLSNIRNFADKVTRLLDLRDASNQIDVGSLLSQYYASAFTNLAAVTRAFSPFTYAELLSQHGFTKQNASTFSNTKLFLQSLYETKKILRAGTDSFLGIDPNATLADNDPIVINRRLYKDPHVELAKISLFPVASELVKADILQSDDRLRKTLFDLEKAFTGLDEIYSDVTSEEARYAIKIRTLSREYYYSQKLSDESIRNLLTQLGYTVSDSSGNQTLFDSVVGQLGSRITDDRSTVNQNSISSIASKIVDNKAVLTFETDYLESDDGAIYTPGSSYYVGSALQPGDNGFSLSNSSDLVKRFNGVVDKYVDFIGKFNILPKNYNKSENRKTDIKLVDNPIEMTNALYSIFVDPSTNAVRPDVASHKTVTFLIEASTNPKLRSNLLLYFYYITNVGKDGLASEPLEAPSGPSAELTAVRNQNARVSSVVDKVIVNMVTAYKNLGNSDYADVENSLRNFNDSASLLSKGIAFISSLYRTCIAGNEAIQSSGRTRYSFLSDMCMISQALQLFLDSVKRYIKVKANSESFSRNTSGITANLSRTLVQSVKNSGVNFGVSVETLKQAIITRLQHEDDLVLKTALAPLNTIRVCRDGLESYVFFLQNSSNVAVLNDILRIVGDKKLVELLLDRGQLQGLVDTLQDLVDKIELGSPDAPSSGVASVLALSRTNSVEDDIKIFDDSFVTSKTLDVLKTIFSDASFGKQLGSNIRMLSVGLPHGFSSKLRSKFKLTTFSEQTLTKRKQNDVVIIDFYKLDVRYPDLIFKPISKVFELSRFAVRNENLYKEVRVGTALNDTLDAIPTRDYSNISSPSLSYGVENVSNDVEYDFMAAADKKSLTRNHVMSYALELYFRLLSGMPLSEKELYVADPDDNDRPAPFITKLVLENVAKKVFNVPDQEASILDLSSVSRIKPIQAASSIKFPSTTAPTSLLAELKTVSKIVPIRQLNSLPAFASVAVDISKKRTVYTDRDLAAKRLLSPKLLERAFFVPIDPDDYEIDYEETNKSEIGKSTFAKLQQAGEILVEETDTGVGISECFKLIDLKSEPQFVFEKYFVTVRTYEPLGSK